MFPVFARPSLALTAAFAVAGASACAAPYVNRGATLYEHGRYIEAAEVFERTEYRLAESPDGERARYALYRGLTFVQLGDLGHARLWLSYAYQVERKEPGTLGKAELGIIESAWAEVEAGGAPPAGPGAVAAVGAQPGAAEPNGERAIAPAGSFASDEL